MRLDVSLSRPLLHQKRDARELVDEDGTCTLISLTIIQFR